MTTKLNRRTFIALLGATAATAAVARPARFSRKTSVMQSPPPRCFMMEQKINLPSRPKTAAITYLHP